LSFQSPNIVFLGVIFGAAGAGGADEAEAEDEGGCKGPGGACAHAIPADKKTIPPISVALSRIRMFVAFLPNNSVIVLSGHSWSSEK
jgi:hypothetical protein